MNPRKKSRSSTDAKPETRRRGWKWWAGWGLAIALFAALVTGAAMRYYPRYRQKQLMERAESYVAFKNYNAAALTVSRVLKQDGRNLEAVRLMAEIADAAGSPASLIWRRRLVELEPGKVDNHLKLAAAALAFGNTVVAKDALAAVSESAKDVAQYHELSGKVALALNLKDQVEPAFAAAARLDPANQEYAFNLAAQQLSSPSAETREAARKRVEGFLKDPSLFRRSSRLLIDDAIRQNEGAKALSLANDLRRDPEAAFQDRLIYLSLLHQLDRKNFAGYLTDLQDEAANDKTTLYSLLSWLNSNNCALIALEWSKRLPAAKLSEMPVPVAVAQAYVRLGDWAGLRPIVADPPDKATPQVPGSGGRSGTATIHWEQYEFMRYALLARSLRGGNQEKESAVAWNNAVQDASGRPEALQVLAGAALDWKWESESTALLWQLAEGVNGAQWALDHLSKKYTAAKSAGNLLRVVTRTLELDPTNDLAQNNVAMLSFLLGVDIEQGLKLSGALHAKDPANTGYASTHAFGLHLHGKTEEGLAVLRNLGDARLEEPAVAAYYGIMLAAVGSRDAAKYLDLAKEGALFPEELQLVEDARTSRAASKVRASTSEK